MSGPTMTPEVRAFWEAIGENGPVPFDKLGERIGEVLTQRPEFIRLEGVDSYALYSGGNSGSYTGDLANNLANRSGGKVGIIDNTTTGKALGEFTGLTEGIDRVNVRNPVSPSPEEVKVLTNAAEARALGGALR